MTGWGWFVAGIAVGLAHVLTQWWTVNRLQPGSGLAAMSWMMAGILGRLAIAGVVLLLALSASVSAGLLTFGGWWLGRWPLLIWYNK